MAIVTETIKAREAELHVIHPVMSLLDHKPTCRFRRRDIRPVWPDLSVDQMLFYGLIKVSMAHYTACRLTSSGPPLSPPSSRSISRCCSSQRPRDTAKLFLHIFFFFLGCFFLWCVNCCNQTGPFGREIDSLWRFPRCISQQTVWDGTFFKIQNFCQWLMMEFE